MSVGRCPAKGSRYHWSRSTKGLVQAVLEGVRALATGVATCNNVQCQNVTVNQHSQAFSCAVRRSIPPLPRGSWFWVAELTAPPVPDSVPAPAPAASKTTSSAASAPSAVASSLDSFVCSWILAEMSMNLCISILVFTELRQGVTSSNADCDTSFFYNLGQGTLFCLCELYLQFTFVHL